MGTHAEMAEAKFREGYNCAQSVLFSFCEELGLDAETALKLSCGLGAGMGRQGEVCGAVSGGIVVLGLKFGRGKNDKRAETDFAAMTDIAILTGAPAYRLAVDALWDNLVEKKMYVTGGVGSGGEGGSTDGQADDGESSVSLNRV